MVNTPNEQYYFKQYWNFLTPHLPEVSNHLVICDLGCSQGRFSEKLAAHFPLAEIYACDISDYAIFKAKSNAEALGISDRIHYETQAINQYLPKLNFGVDIMMMIEVAFFYPDWENDLNLIVSKLNLNGLIVMSFRPQYYDALSILRAKLFDKVPLLLTENLGKIYDSNVIYSWYQSKEICKIFSSQEELEFLGIYGVGVCSGIKGDPHDVICQPSHLTQQEQEVLMKIEIEIGRLNPDLGRYMLVVARKTYIKA